MLPKKNRLERRDFSKILVSSRFLSTKHLGLRYKTDLIGPKVGASISKKVSKSAVSRNTFRRRVYSAVWPYINLLPKGLYLISAKSSADNLKSEALKIELEELLKEVKRL
jgi:ribonuclease P protein component